MAKDIIDLIDEYPDGFWVCSACGESFPDEEDCEFVARRPVCMACYQDYCENSNRMFDERVFNNGQSDDDKQD